MKLSPKTKFKVSWMWVSGTTQSMEVPRGLLEHVINAISNHPSTFDITVHGNPEIHDSFSCNGIAIGLWEDSIVA